MVIPWPAIRIAARRRRGRRIVAHGARWPLLLLPIVGASCVELPRPAQEKLAEAEKDYRGRDYRGARAKLDEILRHYPAHQQSAEAYYLRAMCRIAQSDKLGAATDIRKCLELAGKSDLALRASATAASLDFEAGAYADAVRHFAAAFERSPAKPFAEQDLMRFRYGVCLQRIGQWAASRQQFAAVFQRSPSSPLVSQARAMYEWSHDYFVIQCGAFREQAAAIKRARELQAAGLAATVETRSRLNEALHVVSVGNYNTYAQAQQALPSVRKKARDAVIYPG